MGYNKRIIQNGSSPCTNINTTDFAFSSDRALEVQTQNCIPINSQSTKNLTLKNLMAMAVLIVH